MGPKRFPLLGLILPIFPGVAAASTSNVFLSTGSASAHVALSTTVAPSTQTWRSLPNHAFRVGEKLSFNVRWGMVTAGKAVMTVPKIDMVGSRPAYHIRTEANSAGIVDTFYKTHDLNETWLDQQSLSTLRYEKHIREGKYKVEAVIEFDQMNHRYRDQLQRLDKGTTQYIEGDTPPYVMDVLGGFYYVRTQNFNVGDSFVIDVYDTRKIWPLIVNVKKREKIKVAAGKFDCFRVEPVLREAGIFVRKGKKLEVWLTADDRHMPVMMRSEVAIGHVTAELVSYETGGQ